MVQQAAAAATSILEFLTYPNPSVSHLELKNKTNTRGLNWHFPRKVRRWKEFDDSKLLEDVFGGRLLVEARRGGRILPPYPTVHPQVDCMIRNEDDTRDLLNKWTKTIVTAALDPVHDKFYPAIWCKGDFSAATENSDPPSPQQEKKRTQPARQSSTKARTPKKTSLSKLRSDSGSIPWNPRYSWREPADNSSDREEIFPKEYKPANKWRSEWMTPLIDESERWCSGALSNNYAMPVKQAFSYCIQHMCRYGCILTCKEAFIFQISALDEEPSQGTNHATPNCYDDGSRSTALMEYVSIPWDNHYKGDAGKLESWTVNLALWFMHILAGNNAKAGWKYAPLRDEILVVPAMINSVISPPTSEITDGEGDNQASDLDDDEESGSSDSDESNTTMPFEISPAVKRKRGHEAEDGYNLSFSKRPFLEIGGGHK